MKHHLAFYGRRRAMHGLASFMLLLLPASSHAEGASAGVNFAFSVPADWKDVSGESRDLRAYVSPDRKLFVKGVQDLYATSWPQEDFEAFLRDQVILARFGAFAAIITQYQPCQKDDARGRTYSVVSPAGAYHFTVMYFPRGGGLNSDSTTERHLDEIFARVIRSLGWKDGTVPNDMRLPLPPPV